MCRVTNTTGAAAMLYGWINYNANGVFDNATERASVAVPNGTNNLIKTFTFPVVPLGFTGTTFARFRLSTDAAAANPTGAATDGEVEDYWVTITKPSNGTADSEKTTKIASGTNGGPTLADYDAFGHSVASLGDLDGDGVTELAVGAYRDDTGGTSRGAVHVLFLNADGTVKNTMKIASSTNGGPVLAFYDLFGSSVASLGDLDGDGVTDLVVGAPGDSTGGTSRGAVHVLFLNANGTVKNTLKIASSINGGPNLANGDDFGRSVATLGDLDGDGVIDLAVGASLDDTGGANRGAVYVLFLNAIGTVKNKVKIASSINGGPILANVDRLGSSVASLGDLDGDWVTDLAVGAAVDDTGGPNHGAVHVLFLNANGTVKNTLKIASSTNGGPILADVDLFGSSVASLGDLDGDGVTDLAVGSRGDENGGPFGSDSGAMHVLFLNANGSVKNMQKIASDTNGGPVLLPGDNFGNSVASLGDLDGDGITDLAVGAHGDDTGAVSGTNRGAVHVLFLKPLSAASLPGDYNQDSVVNAADYTVWRDTLGSMTDLRANGDNTGAGAGVINEADYDFWKAHFGEMLPGMGSGALAAVSTAGQASSGTKIAALTKSVSHGVQPQLSPAGAVVQADRPPNNILRRAMYDRAAVAASQDNALAAWLASRPQGALGKWPAFDVGDLRSDHEILDAPRRIICLSNLLSIHSAFGGCRIRRTRRADRLCLSFERSGLAAVGFLLAFAANQSGLRSVLQGNQRCLTMRRDIVRVGWESSVGSLSEAD